MTMLWTAVIALSLAWLLGANASIPQQQPFNLGVGGQENVFDFIPFGSLDALSTEQYTTLRHPLVPGYGLRVKKSPDFCDGTVK